MTSSSIPSPRAEFLAELRAILPLTWRWLTLPHSGGDKQSQIARSGGGGNSMNKLFSSYPERLEIKGLSDLLAMKSDPYRPLLPSP